MHILLNRPQKPGFIVSFFSSSIIAIMSSKQFLRLGTVPAQPLPSRSSLSRLFGVYRRQCPAIPSRSTSRIPSFHLKSNEANYTSGIPMPVYLEGSEKGLDTKATSLKVLRGRLEELGFDMHDCSPGQYNNLLCPMCKGGHASEKSLSLSISSEGGFAMWQCFRGKCGWSGTTKAFANNKRSFENSNAIRKAKETRKLSVDSLQLQPLCDELISYFSSRSITAETIRRNGIMQRKHMNQVFIAFPYYRMGELVSCKYRSVEKKFWQEADTERIFYGLDDIEGQSDIIIVEGEMDKLAMEEAGFRNCVSVPDGAPAKVSSKDVPPEDQDLKYQFLWNCKDYLKQASRIILATDGDGPGQALAEELARRLGRERCWRVKWPKKNADSHFKDANEVLIYMGPGVLRDVVENAELYPIRGLFRFSDYSEEIDAYYYQTGSYEFGVHTGWRALKDLYNVVPGELTIVTGVPNSGKSEWIDALLCNINEQFQWKFALCSMENKVQEHARKLLEKHIKKPFFKSRYGESAERMSREEFEQGKKWLDDTFYLIRCENDSLPSIKWVLGLAKAAVLRHGVRGLVIDPYNELDHQRPSNQTETEYVSHMLTAVKRFAQFHSCHVWFVAHPRQLQNWCGSPPNLYDISGSAHFINKCDNGIVVHRNRDAREGPMDQVQICVRKVRNKVAGTIGDAFLSYDRVTGQYLDLIEESKIL
ncbi:hypothetical protein SAY87_009699 [Trapa incisa]|uniref:SF4 helicase domain-containing protein n=1 Tax=Trapa incisa TaxID=236973 RepID=A0AAN7PXH6_9MYRT|nr:hypothetical protein SAY87_009699 [Trapa incisa]